MYIEFQNPHKKDIMHNFTGVQKSFSNSVVVVLTSSTAHSAKRLEVQLGGTQQGPKN